MAWEQDGLCLLDQTRLPGVQEERVLHRIDELVRAMQDLTVRGAPALGCAAAYGMVLELPMEGKTQDWIAQLRSNAKRLEAARPTAVNLAVGVRRQFELGLQLAKGDGTPKEWTDALLASAREFHHLDQASCLALGEHALSLLSEGCRILTHCNAGALATGGIGTALAPIHLAHARGMQVHVYADETRPLRQGTRLTAWELARHGVSVDVLPDGAAATLLAQGKVDLIFVGSDRIAANGDVANKIGTYPLAVLAMHHEVPFHVLAPATTVDPCCPDGASIPIEQRAATELYDAHPQPQGVGVFSPAFDVTPADLVGHIVTEHGLFCPHGQGALEWQAYVASLPR
ncbi:MAG: S-methyl-5-thioribose-1-phosphate isomerase [Planctomycetota bacterium]